ncbi:Protein bric-a-brac 1 [Harpegnathos saltator]|uniref:Protein bric-a-brac 1 n=1 Tax=Harpegnathos saltator TaxID=610380 RepID=E2BJ91_HARSA|nr:Protein bric-a-brac 1 [Harpegnathos saltator]
MAGQHYCLRWNNYQSNMTSVFHQLLQTEAFVDVTLACNEASLKAHKVVLSACSSYFQKLLLSNPCKHPTIIMPQDVCFTDLKFIIEFVYRGEIDVSQAELQVSDARIRSIFPPRLHRPVMSPAAISPATFEPERAPVLVRILPLPVR